MNVFDTFKGNVIFLVRRHLQLSAESVLCSAEKQRNAFISVSTLQGLRYYMFGVNDSIVVFHARPRCEEAHHVPTRRLNSQLCTNVHNDYVSNLIVYNQEQLRICQPYVASSRPAKFQ